MSTTGNQMTMLSIHTLPKLSMAQANPKDIRTTAQANKKEKK